MRGVEVSMNMASVGKVLIQNAVIVEESTVQDTEDVQ